MIGRILLLACLCACTSGPAEERPNILLLIAEDLGPRIGSYGDPVAQTPNIDSLARRGVRFTNAFTTAGVCAPSRAALITGMHQISIGGQHMRAPANGYLAVPPQHVKAFPELLRASGYFTFTDWKLDYQFSDVFANTGPFTIWSAEGEATDWRGRAPGQPFFGIINFAETHESRLRRHWREDGRLVPDSITRPDDVDIPPYYPDIATVRRDLARHYDNIHYMDQRVGEVLDRLAADGLADSTIVIWTTDHGDGLPRAKRELYDSGIKVPLIMSIPARFAPVGWPASETDKRLISFVDLAPTILALADVRAPEYLHGVDLLRERRDYVYASRDRIDDVYDRQRTVRDVRYKYIRSWYPETPGGHTLAYRDNIDMVQSIRDMFESGELTAEQTLWFEPVGAERLYDLANDPHELNDLSLSPSHAQTLETLREAMDRWLTRVGDWSEESETAMRARFLSPQGELRQTPRPTMSVDNGKVRVTSDVAASIAWRQDGGPWQLYVEPIEARQGTLEIKAVRYGWTASPIQQVTME